MTTNHPAHGPVLLDRLHQIRETLSNAAAQSDGGNLGYAMADAVKVIDGAIAAFGAEPAQVDIEILASVLRNAPLAPSDSQGKPRAPVVPDEDPRDAFERTFKMPKHVTRCGTGYAVTEYSAWLAHDFIRMWEGWKACRAAMLQAGNSPVIPDGWQLVPKEPTEAMNKAGWAAMNEHDAINPTYRAMLAAAPQQEVKSALEHGMQRYAGAMQKLSEGDK
ncbi:hypothetical protein [Citrobacter braakii]|uniref:hypothetical protein n=1 Tax=Citrobacter braakii TaxID=57706 RepID=UPI00197CD3E3|nr:hypothetical protein [Citrobacter braakii]MBN4811641.1 hypothetical protein [Citrobacter braakii]MBN4816834.1 hypothetical protein [Citrobacter braakii]MBN4854417.1 hypothetical protein [Citrobacter braakii]MBN4871955.1 hypothetical protein [Citrobacter braakii]